MYLVGIGRFSEFDRAMATPPYNCEVHSFDPTPTAQRHIAQLRAAGTIPPNMHYHELGVSHCECNRLSMDDALSINTIATLRCSSEAVFWCADDGTLKVHSPAAGDQFTLEFTEERNGPDASKTIEFEVKTISTLMKELGHTHLDMVKIDTEGGEVEDVLGMAADGVLDQIDAYCGEFHYFDVYDSSKRLVWKSGPTGNNKGGAKLTRFKDAPGQFFSPQLQVVRETMQAAGLRPYSPGGFDGNRVYLGASLSEVCFGRHP